MTGRPARSQGVVDLLKSLQRPRVQSAPLAVWLVWNRQYILFQNIPSNTGWQSAVQVIVFGRRHVPPAGSLQNGVCPLPPAAQAPIFKFHRHARISPELREFSRAPLTRRAISRRVKQLCERPSAAVPPVDTSRFAEGAR